MIACPLCGCTTAVIQTRVSAHGARRRRKCTDAQCAGRVTTIEIVVDGNRASAIADGHAVLVARKTIVELQRLAAALGEAP